MPGQTHTADARVLNQRTLEKDHKRLAALLQPGVSVLDIGCGTGAISAGIARACGEGRVVGMDRDVALLDQARRMHPAANLSFVHGDVLTLAVEETFDIVNAARVLQWVSDPGGAVLRMAAAAKPGGLVIALDYNHADNRMEPPPPCAFQRFYEAFLHWRATRGWDNRMGDHLPALFAAAELREISSTIEDEVSANSLWPNVLETLGPQMVAEGAMSEPERAGAMEALYDYCGEQTLVLRAVAGTR
ncbi:MAG: class I SAM-dependent methyltransferase [Bryobacteraceae bacterium]